MLKHQSLYPRPEGRSFTDCTDKKIDSYFRKKYQHISVLPSRVTAHGNQQKEMLKDIGKELYLYTKEKSKDAFVDILKNMNNDQGFGLMKKLYNQIPGGALDMFSDDSNKDGFDDMKSFCKLYVGMSMLIIQLHLQPMLFLSGIILQGIKEHVKKSNDEDYKKIWEELDKFADKIDKIIEKKQNEIKTQESFNSKESRTEFKMEEKIFINMKLNKEDNAFSKQKENHSHKPLSLKPKMW